MQKINDFAMRAYDTALRKEYPDFSRAAIYEIKADNSILHIALETEYQGKRFVMVYRFNDLEELKEKYEWSVRGQMGILNGLYSQEASVSEADFEKKANAKLLLDNPNRGFALTDENVEKVDMWCKWYSAEHGGEYKRAWTALDSTDAWESFEGFLERKKEAI